MKIKTKREVQGVKICSNPRIKAYSNIWDLWGYDDLLDPLRLSLKGYNIK